MPYVEVLTQGGQIGNEITDGSGPEGGKRKALGKKNNRSLRAAAGAGCSAWEGAGVALSNRQTVTGKSMVRRGREWDWKSAGQWVWDRDQGVMCESLR